MNGLWTAEFGSCAGIFCGGVFIFQDGMIRGGDGGYFYLGEYSLDGNKFDARLLLRPFIGNCKSMFETVDQDLILDLVGSLQSENLLIAKGHPRGHTNLTCGVKLIRRSDKLS
jgi:hypothetical protein